MKAIPKDEEIQMALKDGLMALVTTSGHYLHWTAQNSCMIADLTV